jgi:O-antigen/teichoic acid export membrane protein
MLNKLNFSSTYAKGVISLFKGNFWAQLIGLVGTLTVANLYGADTLGVFSKFMSVSSVLAIFFTLRLESAFVLSDEKKNLKTIFSTIAYCIFVGAFFSAVIILLLPNSFFQSVNFLKVYTIFCVLGAFLKAFENVFLSYLLRQKRFRTIAFSRVLFTVVRYSFQIGLFYVLTDLGLILGFIGAVFILTLYFYKVSGNLLYAVSLNDFKKTLKENQNLVSYGVISDNLNAINLNLIPILAGIYFSDSEIGWYFLAIVLLSVPVTFINSSFSKVFFLRASEIFNQDATKLFSFVRKYTLKLLLGLLIPFLMIFFLSKPFIHFALKDEWLTVGIYIQLMSVLFYLRSVYNPLSHLEEVLKKNHIGLVFNIFLFIVSIGAIFYGSLITKDFLTTIYIISFGLPFGYLGMILYFLIVTNRLRFQKIDK